MFAIHLGNSMEVIGPFNSPVEVTNYARVYLTGMTWKMVAVWSPKEWVDSGDLK